MKKRILSLILLIVGDIIKKVKIRAKPAKTWLGGKLATPIACLVNAKTITIRINAVVIIKMLGARVRIVKRIKIIHTFWNLLSINTSKLWSC